MVQDISAYKVVCLPSANEKNLRSCFKNSVGEDEEGRMDQDTQYFEIT